MRRLVSRHAPATRELRWIVIVDSEPFQAVLDESGYGASDTDAAHDVFVFAGYIGKVRDWENFAHRWRAIVADNPKLESANTVKALFRWCGPYSDLARNQADERGY